MEALCVLFLTFISTIYATYVTPTANPIYNYPTVPSVASQSQSVIRSIDGNSVISSYSKAVDTPHSSVRKYDSRINNDAVLYTHLPAVSYAAPVYHKPAAYASAPAPVYHYSPSSYYPASYQPYHAPYYSAPAVNYPTSLYHTPYYPNAVKTVPVHPAAHYSDAATVSHLSFEGLGAHYNW